MMHSRRKLKVRLNKNSFEILQQIRETYNVFTTFFTT